MNCSVLIKTIGVVAGCALLASAIPAEAATILISDNFVGEGPLNGRQSPARINPSDTWTAANDTVFALGGSGLATTAGSPGSIAYANFTPDVNNVYRLSADVNVDAIAANGYLAIGFQSSLGSNQTGDPTTTANGNGNIRAPFIILQRNATGADANVDVYISHVSGNSGNILAINRPAVAGTHRIALELDTTSGNANGEGWKLTSYLDGTLLPSSAGATAGVDGVFTYPTGGIHALSNSNPATFHHVTVAGVNASGGAITNFELSIVPEPSALAAIGLLFGAAARRRRM